jgi:prevent-host-death family protein
MNYILPITALRKDIFAVMERVAKTGDVVEVEKEGKRIVKIVPIRDDAAGRADYILIHVLPSLKGVWKNEAAWTRTAREKRYWNQQIFS